MVLYGLLRWVSSRLSLPEKRCQVHCDGHLFIWSCTKSNIIPMYIPIILICLYIHPHLDAHIRVFVLQRMPSTVPVDDSSRVGFSLMYMQTPRSKSISYSTSIPRSPSRMRQISFGRGRDHCCLSGASALIALSANRCQCPNSSPRVAADLGCSNQFGTVRIHDPACSTTPPFSFPSPPFFPSRPSPLEWGTLYVLYAFKFVNR